jgi:hypothetical protein
MTDELKSEFGFTIGTKIRSFKPENIPFLLRHRKLFGFNEK